MIALGVMAHPARAVAAETLARETGATIIWDRGRGEWDTGSRTLDWCAQQGQDFAMVVQDDALPIPNLRTHVEDAIRHAPSRTCISLYVGRSRPLANRVTLATVQADRVAATWLTHRTLLWGVGIVLPSEDIPRILTESDHPAYDRRIGDWYRDQGRPVLYTWPSLVDHADTPSLLHDRNGERRAHRVGIPQWNHRVVGI